MEIISNGKIPYYIATCPLCGCKFKFIEKETICLNNNNGSISYIGCPYCKCNVSEYDWKRVDD